MNKSKYTTLSIEYLSIESQGRILGGSIVSKNTSVIIPRGQVIDDYDFSNDKIYSQEWSVTDATK